MANAVLRFLGDASSLNRTFKQVGVESATLGDKVGTGLKRGFALGAISATGAGLAIAKFAKDSVSAFKDAEASQLKLSEAFRKFPALADTNIASLRQLNTALAQKTRFDDDATASGQAVLAQFRLTGTQIKTLTPLLQDYAAKTGKDLSASATDFGKALNGQGRALKAIGINFKDTGTTAGNFAELQDLVNQKVGGFAEREGKTAAGRAEILKNKFGELQEKVGSFLVPALDKLATAAIGVANWFDKLSPGAKQLVQAVGALTIAIGGLIVVTRVYTAVQAALDVALNANPVALLVVGLAALGVALFVAYQKSETFRNIVKDVGLGALAFFGILVQGAATAFGWIPGIGPKLRAAATEFDQFRDKANAALLGIQDKVVYVKLKGGDPRVQITDAGSTGPSDSRVVVGDATPTRRRTSGARAAGGPVGADQTYLVGERGPEYLTMGSRGGFVHPNSGGNFTINVYMPPGSDGQSVVNALKEYERRNGSIPIRTAS